MGILIFFLIREIRSARYTKRFEAFALKPMNMEEISIFDKFYQKWWFFIQKISKILSHSVLLKKYSKRYERFISFEEKEKKTAMNYLVIKFGCAILLVLLNFLALLIHENTHLFLTMFISFLFGFFLPDIVLTVQFGKKRKMVEDDLLKAIIVMNNSFKSGRNIMQAVEIVKEELDGPISDEFKKIYMDMNYGLSVDVVFNRFYERVKLEDAKYISSSLSLLNHTGGNIVHVFGTIEKSFFNKKKLMNEMKSLTAASVFVYRLLICLPIFFTLIILILNPSYFNPFFESAFGFFLFFLILALYFLYIYFIKKGLKVKLS